MMNDVDRLPEIEKLADDYAKAYLEDHNPRPGGPPLAPGARRALIDAIRHALSWSMLSAVLSRATQETHSHTKMSFGSLNPVLVALSSAPDKILLMADTYLTAEDAREVAAKLALYADRLEGRS